MSVPCGIQEGPEVAIRCHLAVGVCLGMCSRVCMPLGTPVPHMQVTRLTTPRCSVRSPSCLHSPSLSFTWVRRSVVVDGLLLRVFDRVRQTALYGCCDDPVCDLQLMLHQFTLRAVERVRAYAPSCHRTPAWGP